MSRSAITVPKIKVALNLPRYNVPLLITRARLIHAKMTGNPWFPSAVQLLAELAVAIDELSRAEVVRMSRVYGSVPARNKKRQDVKSLLGG